MNDGQADSRMTAGTKSFAKVVVVEPPADDVPPVTVASLSRPANPAGWHRQDVTVMLRATDNDGGSGVGEIRYAASGALSIPATVVAGDSVAIPVSAEGTTTITFHALDRAGNVEAERMVSVSLDKTAPAMSCEADPASLWPPNHELVDVRITIDLRDPLAGPQSFTLTAAQSSEPDDGSGDGNTSGDIQGFVAGTPDLSGRLRAERSGAGVGRTYALHYSGRDWAGNSAVCTANVVVAHDRSDAPR